MKHKENLAFGRMNFILLAIGMVVVIIGLILMSSSPSTAEYFNPDIFSVRAIKVAPAVTFVGFVSIIFAIVYRKKDKKGGDI